MSLKWEPRSSLSRRSGVKTSYQPRFITYLARFLLNFDRGSANWWKAQARGLPLSLDRVDLLVIRAKQFGAFSESVEVGLETYQGNKGVRELFSVLRSRYGGTAAGKVQLALLFSLISPANQPSDLIERVLGEADDQAVGAVTVTSGGSGYSGARPPEVRVPPPYAGAEPAKLRAELEPAGYLAAVRLTGGGAGYMGAPAVSISPPAGGGTTAQAVARVEGGRVVGIELVEPGSGYDSRDVVRAEIEPPRDEADVPLPDGITASADAFLERRVARLVLEEGGKGYSWGQPLQVAIESPQECGGEASGVAASASVELASPISPAAGVPSVGPYTSYSPGSVSETLQQLLPSDLRPNRTEAGQFTLDLNGVIGASRYIPPQARGLGRRDPVFGPLGSSPVEREASLGSMDYLAFAASGAACTAIVRTGLAPLDVAKTLMQSDAEAYPALRPALASLYEQGGAARLFTAVDVTAASALLLGACGFGVNEFLRRLFTQLAGPQAQTLYGFQISVSAALLASFIAAVATCPFEVVRIRAIKRGADEAKAAQAGAGSGGAGGGGGGGGGTAVASAVEVDDPFSLARGLGTLWAEGGLGALFSALPSLLARELPFQVTKLLVFDATTQLVSSTLPSTTESPLSAALVVLFGGLVAGVVAAAVSTPADTLLTRTQSADVPEGEAPPALLEVAAEAVRDDPLSLFSGLAPRCVFFGALIAGQFALYDYAKQVFKVGPNDIVFVLDVFSDRLSFYQ